MFQPDGGKEGKYSVGRKPILPQPSEKKEKTPAKTQHTKGPTEKPAAKSFNSTRKKQYFRPESRLGPDSDLPPRPSTRKNLPSSTILPPSLTSPGKTTVSKTVPSTSRPRDPTIKEPAASGVRVRETRASRLRAATKLTAAETTLQSVSLFPPPPPSPPPKPSTNSNRPLLSNDSKLQNSLCNSYQVSQSVNDDSAAQGKVKILGNSLRCHRLELSSRRSQSRRDEEYHSGNVNRKASGIGVGTRVSREWRNSVEGGKNADVEIFDGQNVPKGGNMRGNFCGEKIITTKDTTIGRKWTDGTSPTDNDLKKRQPIGSVNSISDLKGGKTDSRKVEGKKIVPLCGEGHSRKETDSGFLIEIGPLKASILKTRITATSALYEQKPISILKRKSLSQQDTVQTSSLIFPVTFSPSALKEQKDNMKKQGILKKRRSLDENEVRRERTNSLDAKPILKTQRRSSMEELTRRTHSPDSTVPHGILKRKCSKEEEEEPSSTAGEPQGILKRKHSVQLTAATALPATEGPQDSQDKRGPTPDTVRPILKKKPSDEQPSLDTSLSDAPKSILKKKTTSDNDDAEDKPKKPILKTSKTPLAEDPEESSHNSEPIRPILKKEHSGKSAEFDDNEPPWPCSRPRKHSLSDVEGPPAPPATCHSMDSHQIDGGLSTPDPCSASLRSESSSDEGPHLSSRVLSSSSSNSGYKENPEKTVLQIFNSAFQPGSSEKLCRHDQKREHLDLAKENLSTTGDSSVEKCDKNLISTSHGSTTSQTHAHFDAGTTFLTLKATHQESIMTSAEVPELLALRKGATEELEDKCPEIPQQKKRTTGTARSRCARYSTQPVTTAEVETAKGLKPSTTADQQHSSQGHGALGTSHLSKSTSRIQHPKSPIASQLEALLSKSNPDGSSNSILSKLKALSTRPTFENLPLPAKNDPLTASSLTTNNEDHDQKKTPKGPPSSYFPAIVHTSLNNSRSDSSIVKNQSHSGVASGLHASHGKSSSIEVPESAMDGEGDKEAEGMPCRQRDGVCSLRRTTTLHFLSPDGSSADDDMTGASIQERLARLRKNGEMAWQRRRCLMTNVEGELSVLSASGKQENTLVKDLTSRTPTSSSVEKPGPKSTSLADRLTKLDAAQSGWKKRVQPSDALRFTVEGKTPLRNGPDLLQPAARLQRQKRSPKPLKYTRKHLKEASATEEPGSIANSEDTRPFAEKPSTGPVVAVPKNDDETFTSFFNGVSSGSLAGDILEINDEDLDALTHMQSSQLLVLKKNIKRQRRRAAIRNPVKSLASRLESQEYTEVRTVVPQKELRRMKVEKGEKVSQLAVEALAGLASSVDFTAVSLKRAEGRVAFADAPYKEPMLLQVKGRRHVQTRLVEPVGSSVNAGDCFILVTRDKVFHYVGRLANVIERSRGAEICLHIQQKGDLGCSAESVITIGEGGRATVEEMKEFWDILGGKPGCERAAGAPDEDEIFEGCLVDTNMVYEVVGDELVPNERFWGSAPKMEILDPNKVLVFDFGSEFYVWNGKSVDVSKRKTALELGRKLWDEGFDYSDCVLCPLTAASVAGSSEAPGNAASGPKVGASRPPWALFAKITQNMETVLFREKFLDWPDYSRVIKKDRKGEEEDEEQGEETGEGVIPCSDLKPCEPASMIENVVPRPDLVLEGSHLGRGLRHFDEETRRCSEIATRNVTVWHISEYEYTEVPECSLGQFHMGDSYVVRWYYTVTVVGRELSGQPSKHLTTGRDRYAYFCWQGQDSPINDKGAAACLTVELDKENGPQVRVAQGFEPPAFLNMFDGKMVVHRGNRSSTDPPQEWRLFVSRGETDSESVLFEVLCTGQSLRSAASFVLVNRLRGMIIVWHGSHSHPHQRKVAVAAGKRVQSQRPLEFCFTTPEVSLVEETEGNESKEFWGTLGSDRGLYCSLQGKDEASGLVTPRLFYLSSISGNLDWTEVISPYLGEKEPTPFPFLQADLYSASQPALFLLEAGAELWLWQGWEEAGADGGTGTGGLRFQAERRAAMATAIAYWHRRWGGVALGEGPRLVWAGLEPLAFTNRFPFWTEREDVAAMNVKDGRRAGEAVPVGTELERLTQPFYTLSELQSRPLPEGVNPNFLEDYLRAEYFQELFGLSREEFLRLPSWKKKKLKQKTGLF